MVGRLIIVVHVVTVHLIGLNTIISLIIIVVRIL